MVNVSPFHSSKNLGVYHMCTNCIEGNNIETEYKKPGTGNGRLCTECERLQREGKC